MLVFTNAKAYHAFTSELGRFHLDTTIKHELDKPSIHLKELKPGAHVEVVFGEGDDCQDQARLVLKLVSQPTEEKGGTFEVVYAELDEVVLERNIRAGIPNPEKMGGEITVNFSAVFRRGHDPSITMGQNNTITVGKHLFGWIPAPTDKNPDWGCKYRAEVLEARIIA